MKPFTSTDLSRMQDTAESSMFDTCKLADRQEIGRDKFNMPILAYVLISTSLCGFDPTRSREVKLDTQVVLTDGRLRLPLDAPIDNLDRVQHTHRYGVELAVQPIYEVVGGPMRGPPAILFDLRRASDGEPII